MTDIEAFEVETVLAIIEGKLINFSNSCEFGYYLKLKEELTMKLKEHNENI